MTSELKRKLTKTLSTIEQSESVANNNNNNPLSRSYSTIGVSNNDDDLPVFPALASSACYRREGSTLSTISLPAVSPKKFSPKSRIPLPTFSRENLSSGRSTPCNLIRPRPGFGSVSSCHNLNLSNSSLVETEQKISRNLNASRLQLANRANRFQRKTDVSVSGTAMSTSRDDLRTNSGLSTPLAGSKSKIPVWKKSQDKMSTLEDERVARFQKRRTISDLEVRALRKKPIVPPKPLSPVKTLELNAKCKKLNETLKEMQQQNLAASRSSLTQVSSKSVSSLEIKVVPELKKLPDVQNSENKFSEGPKEKTNGFVKVAEEESNRKIKEENQRLENANQLLNQRIKQLSDNEAAIKSQLKDAKDHADLLEFRLLEVEEVAKTREVAKSSSCQDASVETENFILDSLSDSGCGSSCADLQDLYQDFRNEKVSDTKSRLQQLMIQISSASDKSLLVQTVALFETLLAKIHQLQDENQRLTGDLKANEADRDNLVLELESVKSNFEMAKSQMINFEKNLPDCLEKEEVIPRNLLSLKSFDELDRKEDQLPEEYDRRPSTGCYTTKGSASSGISSDLSDSETEHIEFLDEKKSEFLKEEKSTQTFSDEQKMVKQLQKKLSANITLQKENDYDSCADQLDDLRMECNELVIRKSSLESEIENCKGQIENFRVKTDGLIVDEKRIRELEKLEIFLRKQLREWEHKYEVLHRENLNLVEEKCELEEAENDSRLNAQRREQQLSSAVERNNYLNEELSMERQSNNILRKKLESTANKLEQVSNQSNQLESLVLRYEQRVFELEELEVELKEKLLLLEQCLRVAEWWGTFILASGVKMCSRPMITVIYDPENNDKQKEILQTQAGMFADQSLDDLLDEEIDALTVKGSSMNMMSRQTVIHTNVIDQHSAEFSYRVESRSRETQNGGVTSEHKSNNFDSDESAQGHSLGFEDAGSEERSQSLFDNTEVVTYDNKSVHATREDLTRIPSAKDSIPKEHKLQIIVKGLKNKTSDNKMIERSRSEEPVHRSEVNTPNSLDRTTNHEDDSDHESSSDSPTHKKFGLIRYRSLRDHNGRYYLVVKIR